MMTKNTAGIKGSTVMFENRGAPKEYSNYFSLRPQTIIGHILPK